MLDQDPPDDLSPITLNTLRPDKPIFMGPAGRTSTSWGRCSSAIAAVAAGHQGPSQAGPQLVSLAEPSAFRLALAPLGAIHRDT